MDGAAEGRRRNRRKPARAVRIRAVGLGSELREATGAGGGEAHEVAASDAAVGAGAAGGFPAKRREGRIRLLLRDSWPLGVAVILALPEDQFSRRIKASTSPLVVTGKATGQTVVPKPPSTIKR